MISEKPIYVTMPSLCPQKEYGEILKSAWDSGILTHNGPLVQKLEKDIDTYLNSRNLVIMNNGTIAIQLAIKALDLKGEIITSPFSWIATCSAIRWEGCEPVFSDINPETLNIDPAKIEEAITDKTVAIMPVHVFSNPCDIEAINAIAKKHGLKVIYDAAHATAVNYNNRPILEYGDISTVSFHATKLLNSGEGGGCVTMDNNLFERLRRLRFFGHDNVTKEIVEDGQNAKMTEVHAALGLANLLHLDTVRANRKHKYKLYQKLLGGRADLHWQKYKADEYNYSYMPLIFDSEEALLKVMEALNEANVFPRRYFYPSLNTMDKVFTYVEMPASEDIAKRIVCMPLFNDLSDKIIEAICELTINTLDSR
jgi:hypothetical protein